MGFLDTTTVFTLLKIPSVGHDENRGLHWAFGSGVATGCFWLFYAGNNSVTTAAIGRGVVGCTSVACRCINTYFLRRGGKVNIWVPLWVL